MRHRIDHWIALISLLLDRGAKINDTHDEGRTALAEVVVGKLGPDFARVLLDRGADPLVGVRTGSSALEWAIKLNNAELVEMFLEAISTRQYQCNDFARLIPKGLDEMNRAEKQELEEFQARYPPGEVSGEKMWWDRFYIIKAMKRHYWRMMYPAPVT